MSLWLMPGSLRTAQCGRLMTHLSSGFSTSMKTGVFRTLKSATPHLARSRRHAMVVASAASFTPLVGLASYAASKAGVEMLTLAYRQEVRTGASLSDSCILRGLTPILCAASTLTSRRLASCVAAYRIRAM